MTRMSSIRPIYDTEDEKHQATSILVQAFQDTTPAQAISDWQPSLLYENYRGRVENCQPEGTVWAAFSSFSDHQPEKAASDDEHRPLMIASVIFAELGDGYGTMKSHATLPQASNLRERMSAKTYEWQQSTLFPWFDNLQRTAFGSIETPSKKRMYVNLLAVSASVRGKGIGSEMMNALIKKSEEDQAVITLVNYEEHNNVFYGRFGFEVVYQERMPLLDEMLAEGEREVIYYALVRYPTSQA